MLGRAQHASAAIFASLLLGCASLTPPDASSLDGRLAVQVEATSNEAARSMSAPFSLRGDDRSGSFELASPLGTMLARAQWQPGAAVLTTSDGARNYASLDDMAQDMLGESLPMAALMAWLRGRPWSGSSHTTTTEPKGFRQLGWLIDLTRSADGFVTAQRNDPAPRVTVRAKLEARP